MIPPKALYDYLIVGSGLFGSVFAHEAYKAGKRCLVIEKRAHIGGNIYCEEINGINVHKYGAHIFHTDNDKTWEYVNQLVKFNRYTNSPIANYKGKLYNLPFNMNTFYQLWGVRTPQEAMDKINEQRNEFAHIIKPKNLEEQALKLCGKDIYERLIKGYTEKQWGRKCTELPAFIIRRLPFRFIYDNNYFNDTYQGIPIGGYNVLIDRLFEGVDIRLECNYFNSKEKLNELADKVIYTGPIDEYYNYKFGKLEYRTVTFETEIKECANWQGNAVVNYTEAEVPYTRIIEHKHFEMFGSEIEKCPKTIISREYSSEWKEGCEPYYPVNDEKNVNLYQKYQSLAETEANVIFGGRLAEYKYYDMDDVVDKALKVIIS